MQILVVNIPPELTDAELKSMFEEFGTVLSAKVGQDKKTGTSEGYGIVEMPVKHEARASVDALRGKNVQGKQLLVRILRPDDQFHNVTTQRGRGFRSSSQFRGGGNNRGSGVLRRGGQRGS